LCLGLGLLSWLVVEADYHAVLRQLRSVDLAWLAAVFVVPHIGLLLSTIKWQALLTCLGSHVGIAPLFKFYLIGTFFNNFLPSMVGGDIVRIYLLQRLALTTERAIASTFIERFIGFGGMMTLLPLVWLYPSVTEAAPSLNYVVIGAITVYFGLFVLLFSSPTIFPNSAPKRALVKQVIDTLRKSQQQVRGYRNQVGVLLWAYTISVAFYLLAGLTVWLATRAVGASVSFAFVVSVTPLVLLAAAVPISVNGLGVLESGITLLLISVSVPLPEAVLVTILLRVRIFFTAAIGGIFFLLERAPPAASEHPLADGVIVVEAKSNAQL
jgi:uncharacterized protein (TIRG00374 family)